MEKLNVPRVIFGHLHVVRTLLWSVQTFTLIHMRMSEYILIHVYFSIVDATLDKIPVCTCTNPGLIVNVKLLKSLSIRIPHHVRVRPLPVTEIIERRWLVTSSPCRIMNLQFSHPSLRSLLHVRVRCPGRRPRPFLSLRRTRSSIAAKRALEIRPGAGEAGGEARGRQTDRQESSGAKRTSERGTRERVERSGGNADGRSGKRARARARSSARGSFRLCRTLALALAPRPRVLGVGTTTTMDRLADCRSRARSLGSRQQTVAIGVIRRVEHRPVELIWQGETLLHSERLRKLARLTLLLLRDTEVGRDNRGGGDGTL